MRVTVASWKWLRGLLGGHESGADFREDYLVRLVVSAEVEEEPR